MVWRYFPPNRIDVYADGTINVNRNWFIPVRSAHDARTARSLWNSSCVLHFRRGAGPRSLAAGDESGRLHRVRRLLRAVQHVEQRGGDLGAKRVDVMAHGRQPRSGQLAQLGIVPCQQRKILRHREAELVGYAERGDGHEVVVEDDGGGPVRLE
jgi:hypothetical protein